MVDQLADEYANKPVVFMEYDVDLPVGFRVNRWWSSYDGSDSVGLPLVMVDSGQQISNGYVNFYKVYKSMVEAEINRPPKADIEAFAWRETNKVKFSIKVTNLSGDTLAYPINGAMIHGIVYEDTDVGVTNRYVREAAFQMIYSDIAPGSSVTFSLETNDLLGVDWDKLHFIALVDYRPGGDTGPFDILQASIAQQINYSISPNPLVFMVDLSDPPNPTSNINLVGSNSLNWSASEDIAWLAISPTGGLFPSSPTVSIETSKMLLGWQPESYIFIDVEMGNEIHIKESVQVKAFYGSVKRSFLPFINRWQLSIDLRYGESGNLFITRILRHPISKGKAQERENCQYWKKWGNLGQFSINFEPKPLFLGSLVR